MSNADKLIEIYATLFYYNFQFMALLHNASDLILRHKNQQFDYIVISAFYSIKFAI